MTRRPGTVPLSTLRQYQIRPHQHPPRVSERGEFYIRDGWLRPSLTEGHNGTTECCYLVDFVNGEDDRSAYFVLSWSPLREKVIELVLRMGAPVGPCRLISKPMNEAFSLWVIVGIEDDGTTYDPLRLMPEVEHLATNADTL